MTADFRTYIASLIALPRFGTADAVAKAIGMSLSAFSRGVRHAGTLNVEHCLRLAEEVGENPGVVLRLAKKGDVADTIERLYGTHTDAFSRLDREIVNLWHEAEPAAQDALLTLLRALSGEVTGRRRKRAS